MTKELIERIRNICGGCPDCKITVNEAADAIEALQSQLTTEHMNCAMADEAVKKMAARVAELTKLDSGRCTTINSLTVENAQLERDRDTLAAELAAARAQEPSYLLTPDGKCYAYGDSPPLSAGHADATLLKLYAAPTPPVREPTPISQAVRDYNEVVDKYNKLLKPTPPVREPLTDAEIETIAQVDGKRLQICRSLPVRWKPL